MAANPGSISSQPAAAALTGAEVLPLDQAVGSPVAATALVVGQGYRIVSLGSTNWAAAGAGATPAVGTVFGCTAIGTGTGTAQQVETRRATAQEIAARALQDPTAAPTFASLTVSGTATLEHIHGNLAGQVYEHVRNVSGATLAALIPYRVTGSQGDTDRVTIVAARADDPALTPASGILASALANNGDGHGVVSGVITGVNTAGFTSGASLWVAPTGGLTATRPSERIQPIATVGRVHANTGTIVVLPGPALALPAYTGAYSDLSGRPTLGTAAAAATTDFDPAGSASSAITTHLLAASHLSQSQVRGSLSATLPITYNSSTGVIGANTDDSILIIFGEDSTPLTVSTLRTIIWPEPTQLYAIPLWNVFTAPTGAACQFDIRVGGTSIFSTLPTIAAGGTLSSATTPAVFSTAFVAASQTIAQGASVSFHCLQIGTGSGTAVGAGLKVALYVRQVYS
jgi:hypothetical protein